MADKIYINGSAKAITFDNGGTIINCYINLDDAKEKGLVKKAESGREFIAFTIAERMEPSQYGDTHSLYFKPYDKDKAKGGGAKQKVAKSKEIPQEKNDDGKDDLPF